MLPSYMQGTPEELLQRAQDAREAQRQALQQRTTAFNRSPQANRQVGQVGPEGQEFGSNPLGGNAGWAAKSSQWSPAVDALESFAYQDPVSQNQSFAAAAQSDAPGPLSPWQKYDAVLSARGAYMPQPGQRRQRPQQP